MKASLLTLPALLDKTNDDFKAGVLDTIPFVLLFVFYSVAFGMLSAANGLSFSESIGMTILIFSTPLQFIIVQRYEDAWVLIPLVISLNARFALMSASLIPYLRKERPVYLALTSILIVPSVYALCIARFRSSKSGNLSYLLGTGLPLFLAAITSNVLGYLIGGKASPSSISMTASFGLALQFTALAAKLLPRYAELFSFLLGILFAPFAISLFGSNSLVFGPFIVAAFVIWGKHMHGARH